VNPLTQLGQQLEIGVQLGKLPRFQDLGDPKLGRPSLGVDRPLEPLSLGGEPDDAGASSIGSGRRTKYPRRSR
jgi:hypothetical protein